MTTKLDVFAEQFAIAGTFTISRGSKTMADVVRVALTRDGQTGQGECVPYARYGESLTQTIAAIEALRPAIAGGLDRTGLQTALPPGAARNAIDCAFWELEAKLAGLSVAELAGVTVPESIITAYTISLGTPETMAAAARAASAYPLLKLKLGGAGDRERLAAVREAVPQARLVVDANEAWMPDDLAANMLACRDLGIELVEQPLPAGDDAALAHVEHLVPICADESAHGLASLGALIGRYDAVNIKLDKTGGLTEALDLARAAKAKNLKIMVGCMVCTSLATAPVALLAGQADWCDLDGPLLLAADRPDGFRFDDGVMRAGGIWG
ncbi:Mandelate racemase/muconate lactonizing protein [Devosia sp. LC5]|uniref:N-acetyl-D-Glu racemase DgcA n=1 Tax=Devosia sp. LC5 TaxID=1502724 RepID=UPI0004E38CE6|nr:N-acetyl-D-Glu racemase DgcA [Devosia sp. LC5]KFC61243.1 Mandelate racemase/muconate lactonizing protein [Devosia sp. LC5]